MVRCISCDTLFPLNDFSGLAQHYYDLAEQSDARHIGWLNRHLTKHKLSVDQLKSLFYAYFDLTEIGFTKWVKKRFIEKFYGEHLHPFVAQLQTPSRATLLGYVFEHQHFLRQWVRSCAYIIAKTDQDDVVKYELENITTEFGGHNQCQLVPHFELLIRMGESLGVERTTILTAQPLPATKQALEMWNHIAATYHWVEAMIAMHGLELIANRNLRNDGAKVHYFNPELLQSAQVTTETKNFLREGYEADLHHAEAAIQLVEKHGKRLGILENAQATFLKSIDMFDKYLLSRLHRAEQFES